MTGTLFAQQPLEFRSHDSRLGYFYEVRRNEDYHSVLFVYRNRADALGKPVFESSVNIFSAFHTPDAKFFVVNHGSGSYGNVAVVFREAFPGAKPYISESEFRSIMSKGLQKLYPQFKRWDLYHLYSPIRDIRDGEALIRASGDFTLDIPNGRLRQEPFKALFLAMNLTTRTIRPLADQEGLKSWYRGLPDRDAAYGSGIFVSEHHILTNAHVVGDAKRVAVGLGNKEAWADVIAVSKDFDLALLTIAPNSLTGVPVSLAPAAPELGQRVRAYGYPLPMVQGYTMKATDGTVSGLFGMLDNPLHFQTTAPMQPGNSGGALLDEHNQLLGVAVASLDKIVVAKATGALPENVNFGIHLDVVRRFLEAQHVTSKPRKDSKFDPEQTFVQVVRSQ
jgi:S1-C subfamily serine protease